MKSSGLPHIACGVHGLSRMLQNGVSLLTNGRHSNMEMDNKEAVIIVLEFPEETVIAD